MTQKAKPYISNKNHKTGCHCCESCGSTNLKNNSYPPIQLKEWKCNECGAEHLWKYDNDKDYFE
jgi:ribosomal protein L37AE/L43A